MDTDTKRSGSLRKKLGKLTPKQKLLTKQKFEDLARDIEEQSRQSKDMWKNVEDTIKKRQEVEIQTEGKLGVERYESEKQYEINLLESKIQDVIADLNHRKVAGFRSKIDEEGLQEVDIYYNGKEYILTREGEFNGPSEISEVSEFYELMDILYSLSKLRKDRKTREARRELEKEEYEKYYGVSEQELEKERQKELEQRFLIKQQTQRMRESEGELDDEDHLTPLQILLSLADSPSSVRDIVKLAFSKPTLIKYGKADHLIGSMITSASIEYTPSLFSVLLEEIRKAIPSDQLNKIVSKMGYLALREEGDLYIPMENYKQFIDLWLESKENSLNDQEKKQIVETKGDHMNYLRERLGFMKDSKKETKRTRYEAGQELEKFNRKIAKTGYLNEIIRHHSSLYDRSAFDTDVGRYASYDAIKGFLKYLKEEDLDDPELDNVGLHGGVIEGIFERPPDPQILSLLSSDIRYRNAVRDIVYQTLYGETHEEIPDNEVEWLRFRDSIVTGYEKDIEGDNNRRYDTGINYSYWLGGNNHMYPLGVESLNSTPDAFRYMLQKLLPGELITLYEEVFEKVVFNEEEEDMERIDENAQILRAEYNKLLGYEEKETGFIKESEKERNLSRAQAPIETKERRKIAEGPAKYTEERLEEAFQEARRELTFEEAYEKAQQLDLESIYDYVQKHRGEEAAEGALEFGLEKSLKLQDLEHFEKFLEQKPCLEQDLLDDLVVSAKKIRDERFLTSLQAYDRSQQVTERLSVGRELSSFVRPPPVCRL